MTVSQLTNMRILFTLSFPVEANSYTQFTFPSDITIDTSLLSAYTGGGIYPTTGFTFTDSNSSFFQIAGSTGNTSSSAASFITIQQIRNPNKVKETGSLSFTVFTSSGFQIASVSTGVTISASSLTIGSTGIVSITPNSTVVQTANVAYTLIFRPGMLIK